jgi:hypothetical protein
LHSPDLSSPDYFSPKLKIKLKELHFADVAEIEETVTLELKKVQKEEFSAGFQKMYDRANTCIFDNGIYLGKKEYIFLMYLLFLNSTVYENDLYGNIFQLITCHPKTVSN